MSAIPRPHRNALAGEIVNLYEGGDPSEQPIPATVVESYASGAVKMTYARPGYPTMLTKTCVHHIHATYWDNVAITAKQSSGAWDFHPVYKGVFDKWLLAYKTNEIKRQQIESEKNELSVDEYNAITALERHGDNITKICEETGLTAAALKKLPRFNEELKKVKDANFAERNA